MGWSPGRRRFSVPAVSCWATSSACHGALAAHRSPGHGCVAPCSCPSHPAGAPDACWFDCEGRWESSRPAGSRPRGGRRAVCGGRSRGLLLPRAPENCSLTPAMLPCGRRWLCGRRGWRRRWAHVINHPAHARRRCPMSWSGMCARSLPTALTRTKGGRRWRDRTWYWDGGGGGFRWCAEGRAWRAWCAARRRRRRCSVQWAGTSRALHLGVVVAETPEHGKDVLGGRAGASRSEDHPFAATWEWSALLPQRHGIPRASQPVHDSRPWMCSTQPHVASLANSRPQRPHMSTVQRTQLDGSAADRLCTSVLPARYSLASCRTKTFPLSS